jgi:eukaryotic translation initiation factor 2C
MEILRITPGQKYKGRLSGAATADMIRATSQKPRERMNQINDAVFQTLKYDQNPYIASFGMQVDPELMKIDARILTAPTVIYRNSKVPDSQSGVWNLRGAKLVNPVVVHSMAFVYFIKATKESAQESTGKVLRSWGNAGMDIRCQNPPIFICNPDIEGNIKGVLMAAFKESTMMFRNRCQLVVCIVDGSKKVYETIKVTALCEAGLVTQCMVGKNVHPARVIKEQYMANVALKVF